LITFRCIKTVKASDWKRAQRRRRIPHRRFMIKSVWKIFKGRNGRWKMLRDTYCLELRADTVDDQGWLVVCTWLIIQEGTVTCDDLCAFAHAQLK
jgi:hypothetical protein